MAARALPCICHEHWPECICAAPNGYMAEYRARSRAVRRLFRQYWDERRMPFLAGLLEALD